MRKFLGLAPVLMLTLAVAVSTVMGLHLSKGKSSAREVADELGCDHVIRRQFQAQVPQTKCRYHGERIVILSFPKGPHTLYGRIADYIVIGPAGTDWVIGCANRDNCVDIQRKFGGLLASGPMLGLSIYSG